MMEYLNSVLPIIIYILLSVLLVLLIMISFKLINTMNKLDVLVEDVSNKVQTLNGFFHVIDAVTDKISLLSDKTIDKISNFIQKVFSTKKKRKKKVTKEDDDNE